MKNWLLLSTISVACFGALVLLPRAGRQADAASGRAARAPLKIAVVDLGQVFRQYKKADALLDDVKAISDAKSAKLKDLFAKSQELVKTIKEGELDPDSSEYREHETKFFQLESYAKAFKSSAEKELQLHNQKALLAVYNEIQEVLQLFCDQNGFTVIMRVDTEPWSVTDPQSLARLGRQDVIYHDSRDDITAPIVAYLNRRYDATAAKATPAKSDQSSPPASQPNARATNPPSSTSRKSNAR